MNEKYLKSNKQEKRITRSFQQIKEEAKKTMASGALWIQKSDVITKQFRVEAKTKMKPSDSMTLKKEWFDKIGREAFESGKIGLVVFSFGDNDDIVGIKFNDFLALVEELNTLREKCNEKD